MDINYKFIDDDAMAPTVNYDTDAGVDFYINESVVISGQSTVTVGTGIALDIPNGYFGKIEERSGMATKYPLIVKAGIIDAGYRGEIKIVLSNTSSMPVKLPKHTKIAQMVFHKKYKLNLKKVNKFEGESKRGEKGFGSSDK